MYLNAADLLGTVMCNYEVSGCLLTCLFPAFTALNYVVVKTKQSYCG